MRNQEGARCPYDEFAPHTLEGWLLWELVRSGERLRVTGIGAVIGLDVAAMLELADARGLDRAVTACLLPYADAGVIAAAARARSGDQ